MTQEPPPLSGPNYKDKKTSLIVVGIIQIIMGGFFLMMVPMILASLAMPQPGLDRQTQQMSLKTVIPGTVVYLFLAIWFIWMGIGILNARRWARALSLVSASLWLAFGIGALIAIPFIIPGLFEQIAQETGEEMPKAVITVLYVFTFGFLAFFYLIVPGCFVLYFRNKNVKATCEHRDPIPRWTDLCPLPVLAVSLAAGVSLISMPFTLFYNFTFPLFGVIVSGLPGALVSIGMIIAAAYIAWGFYRLSTRAWWTAATLAVLFSISTLISFSRISFIDLYEKMDFPEEQIVQLEQMNFFQGPGMHVITLLWLIVILGYFIYIRKYFQASHTSP